MTQEGTPLRLVLWDRGGAPGPGYEQNLLTVTLDAAGPRAEYVKVRWDPAAPPYRSDAYTLALDPGEPRALLVLAEGALAQRFAEESDPRTGDGTKLTLQLALGTTERAKTFFARWPEALGELQRALEALMARCEAQGAHEVR